jgi:hypothetical protein
MNAQSRHFPNYPGKVVIRHVIEAARANGIDVAGIKVSPDGSIEVTDARGVVKAPETVEDEIRQWERENGHGD